MKQIIALSTLLLLLLISRCGENGKPGSPGNDQPVTSLTLKEKVRLIYGDIFDTLLVERTDKNESESVIGGRSFNSVKEYGVKFTAFTNKREQVQVHYRTPLLEGQVREGETFFRDFSGIPYKILVYSTGSYFYGNSGGEVFLYLIDFAKKRTYASHYGFDMDNEAKLYIDTRLQNKEMINFITAYFRTDFPPFQVVNRDFEAY